MKFLNPIRRLRRWLAPTQAPEPWLTAENPRFASYKIGRGTYGGPRVLSWRDGTALEIGSFCSISDTVTIMLGGEHRTDWVTTYPFSGLFPEAGGFKGHPHTKGNVLIGNDVWIGYEALILSGVKIGNGAVVAARSIVTRDVKPYSIVAGNPARHVRFRFDERAVKALEEIAWWDWPMDKIKAAWPLLLADDVEAFIAAYGSPGVHPTNR
jgi:acetyltransferase-like isoleucine patch superfamily enzyme